MFRRRFTLIAATVAFAAGAAACNGGDESGGLTVFPLDDERPGDTVGLIAVDGSVDGGDNQFVDIADRLDGTIRRIDIDDLDAGFTTLATIPVSTDGEQRGLLGQVVIDGTRYAAWTQPDTFELVVGAVDGGGPGQIVWSAGRAGGGAIGGVLGEFDGQVLLGLGRNTAWDAETEVGGAILSIDPADAVDGPDPAPSIYSVGYTNPWAFAATESGSIWVADNAAGPDPDDESQDDIERIGRADVIDDRNEMDEVPWAGRAPTAMIELPDGRLGICGFLDNELRAYEIVDDEILESGDGQASTVTDSSDDPDDAAVDRAGTIMPCLTGAAVFDDGTIVTLAQTDTGIALHILRP